MKSVKGAIPGVPASFEAMGDWYAPFDMMHNDLGFWYPILLRAGVPTPRTIIVNADGGSREADLINLLDGVYPAQIEFLLVRIQAAMNEIGFPCFFRGGQLSAKHDWKNSCFVETLLTNGELVQRMHHIVERCAVGNIGASPLLYENWVVRKLIPTERYFTHFNGDMPIVKEARFFLRDGVIDCWHPYWPRKAFRSAFDEAAYKRLCEFSLADQMQLKEQALAVAALFPGYWSCDFLLGTDGRWYCTDMAQGEDSFHIPDCPKAMACQRS